MNCPHCNTHIDEHPANACLNEWIAVDIMGEEKPSVEHDYIHLTSIDSDGGNWYCLNEYDEGDICVWHAKNFSGYIAVAWEVVEKVNQDNAMTLGWYNPDGRTSRFSVAFGFGKTVMGSADTAPLAICRAAIKVTCTEAT